MINKGSLWLGLIDDVRIYDAALSAEDTEALRLIKGKRKYNKGLAA